MIVLDLHCSNEHRFEGWFGSAAAFEEQLARALVSCPVCGSTAIRRLPSAPYVQTGQAATEASPAARAVQAARNAAFSAQSTSPAAARRAFEAMMTMGKIDVAAIEAAVRG